MAANKDDKKLVARYVAKARTQLVHQIAARAWSLGVPWADALRAASAAVAAGDAASKPLSKPKAFPKGKAKGKGKGRK